MQYRRKLTAFELYLQESAFEVRARPAKYLASLSSQHCLSEGMLLLSTSPHWSSYLEIKAPDTGMFIMMWILFCEAFLCSEWQRSWHNVTITVCPTMYCAQGACNEGHCPALPKGFAFWQRAQGSLTNWSCWICASVDLLIKVWRRMNKYSL